MKKSTTILVLSLLCTLSFAQTGPGGVGSTDGSSNLKIWLRADDLNGDGDLTNNPSNGNTISSWVDVSGNSNNFTQSDATHRPWYTTGTYNSVSCFTSITYRCLNATSTGEYTDASMFFATLQYNNNDPQALFNDDALGALRAEQWNNTGKVGYTRYPSSTYTSTVNSIFNINSIYSFHKASASSDLDIRVNNNSGTLNIGSSAYGLPYSQLGRDDLWGDSHGEFYEIIVFNSKLNSAQIIIVDNYLSAKYGSISIQNDLYTQDNSGNGNYDHDVAGIGRVDASNIHNDAQGTGVVRILNPTDLGDSEFLFWGHDNGAFTSTETTDVPAGVSNRLERVWRVSEQNN